MFSYLSSSTLSSRNRLLVLLVHSSKLPVVVTPSLISYPSRLNSSNITSTSKTVQSNVNKLKTNYPVPHTFNSNNNFSSKSETAIIEELSGPVDVGHGMYNWEGEQCSYGHPPRLRRDLALETRADELTQNAEFKEQLQNYPADAEQRDIINPVHYYSTWLAAGVIGTSLAHETTIKFIEFLSPSRDVLAMGKVI